MWACSYGSWDCFLTVYTTFFLFLGVIQSIGRSHSRMDPQFGSDGSDGAEHLKITFRSDWRAEQGGLKYFFTLKCVRGNSCSLSAICRLSPLRNYLRFSLMSCFKFCVMFVSSHIVRPTTPFSPNPTQLVQLESSPSLWKYQKCLNLFRFRPSVISDSCSQIP